MQRPPFLSVCSQLPEQAFREADGGWDTQEAYRLLRQGVYVTG